MRRPTLAGLQWVLDCACFTLQRARRVLPEVGGPWKPTHLAMASMLEGAPLTDMAAKYSLLAIAQALGQVIDDIAAIQPDLALAIHGFTGIGAAAVDASGDPRRVLAPPEILDAAMLMVRWAAERQVDDFTVCGIGPRTHLRNALRYFRHEHGCVGDYWTGRKPVRTWFGFLITANKCTCGAIELALLLDTDAAKQVRED